MCTANKSIPSRRRGETRRLSGNWLLSVGEGGEEEVRERAPQWCQCTRHIQSHHWVDEAKDPQGARWVGDVCSPEHGHHNAWTYSLSFFPRITKWPESNGQLSYPHAFVTDSFYFFIQYLLNTVTFDLRAGSPVKTTKSASQLPTNGANLHKG